jgi:hypothetical protein
LSSRAWSPAPDSILALLRILLEPHTSADERRRVAEALAKCAPESLATCLAQPQIASALRIISEAYPAPTENRPAVFHPGCHGRYSLGADLRLLINDACNARIWTLPIEIEAVVTASERARLIAVAHEADPDATGEVARGIAWTQLDPGAPLLRWRPEQRSQITAYVQYALDRGGADASMPLPYAHALNQELACRAVERTWFDSTYAWMEAWTACTPMDTVARQEVKSTIRRLHRMLRVGVALRAASAEMRIPRLLAIAELGAAIVVIRATGKADLIRAHRAGGGDPSLMARTHQKGDRDAGLLVEVAIGEVLRPLSHVEVEALHESERHALRFIAQVLSMDARLHGGVLSSAELCDPSDTEPSDGNP